MDIHRDGPRLVEGEERHAVRYLPPHPGEGDEGLLLLVLACWVFDVVNRKIDGVWACGTSKTNQNPTQTPNPTHLHLPPPLRAQPQQPCLLPQPLQLLGRLADELGAVAQPCFVFSLICGVVGWWRGCLCGGHIQSNARTPQERIKSHTLFLSNMDRLTHVPRSLSACSGAAASASMEGKAWYWPSAKGSP